MRSKIRLELKYQRIRGFKIRVLTYQTTISTNISVMAPVTSTATVYACIATITIIFRDAPVSITRTKTTEVLPLNRTYYQVQLYLET